MPPLPPDARSWRDRMKQFRALLLFVGLPVGLLAATIVSHWFEYRIRIVNMIPESIADEEWESPEPFLAVNPTNRDEIVASAMFLGIGEYGGRPCPAFLSPVLRSADRGDTWSLHCALKLDFNYFAGDITIAYSGLADFLYGGYQKDMVDSQWRGRLFKAKPSMGEDWNVTDLVFDSPSLDDVHLPFTAASSNAASSLVAIGADARNAPNCNTGVVYWNLPSEPFTRVCVAPRPTTWCDGDELTPVVRTAVHSDETVYALTYRIASPAADCQSALLDVVLFRHDPGANVTSPFASLSDFPMISTLDDCTSRDGERGFRVARCVPVPWDPDAAERGWGQVRRVFTDIAVAVDPRNSRRVFVAWGDTASGKEGMTLHLQESRDGGATWRTEDLATVETAVNPSLAVTTQGRLGFAYQQMEDGTSGKWTTKIRIFSDHDPPEELRTYTLAKPPVNTPQRCQQPYLGDYMHLQAIGKHFYGVFSASGDVGSAEFFPEGVAYRRDPPVPKANPCYGDDTKTPELSIDPYFYALEPRWFASKALTHVYVALAQAFRRN